jgi:hypothetical protein
VSDEYRSQTEQQPRKRSISEKKVSREFVVRDALCERVGGGQKEVACPAGRIDLLTTTTVYEVKLVTMWKAAIGQVIAYHCYYTSHAMALELFGSEHDVQRLRPTIEHVCNKWNIQVEFIQLPIF